MTAIIVDLKDCNIRTPEQTIRVFFSTYDSTTVRHKMFHFYASYADNLQANTNDLTPDDEALITLIDQLVLLVEAIETQRKEYRKPDQK